VDPQKAKATSEWQGRTYYFCCAGCRTKFEADPSSFTSEPAEKSSPAHIHRARPASIGQATQGVPTAAVTREGATPQSIYTCPMDPEVRQEGPGACPKCGMALEPLDVSAAMTKTEYTSPLHRDAVRQ